MTTPTPLYTANALSKGGRAGNVKSDDGLLDLNLAAPKTMGGDGAVGTNPEQLFAAGYSACFAGAAVTFHKGDDGYSISTKLTGTFPEFERSKAEALMQAAHQACPYSKATRGNMPVELTVA